MAACCLLLANCSSFQDVRDLEKIQNAPGIYPKALFYCGSDDMCHHFEQETPLGDLTVVSKSLHRFMVSRQAVTIPEGAEFLHSSYTGKKDERRRKMILTADGTNARRGRAEFPLHDDGG